MRVSAARAAEKPPKEPIPIKVDVKIVRVGDSVRLDISGLGRFRPAKHAMETPSNWIVHLLADKQMMPRTVNGSAKIQRFEVGNPADQLWDIEVWFSMAYAIPSNAEELTVRITPPESPMFERTVATSAVETKRTKLDEKREQEAKKAEKERKKRDEKRRKRRERRKKAKKDKAKKDKAKKDKAKKD